MLWDSSANCREWYLTGTRKDLIYPDTHCKDRGYGNIQELFLLSTTKIHLYEKPVRAQLKTENSLLPSRWLSGKETPCQCRRHRRRGFDPWVGKIPWRRKWQLTSSTLTGRMAWVAEPGGLQCMGLQREGLSMPTYLQGKYMIVPCMLIQAWLTVEAVMNRTELFLSRGRGGVDRPPQSKVRGTGSSDPMGRCLTGSHTKVPGGLSCCWRMHGNDSPRGAGERGKPSQAEGAGWTELSRQGRTVRNHDVSPCGCSIASRSEGWELRSLVGWFKQSWNKAGAGVSLSHRRWQNWSVWGLGEPRAHGGKTCSRALIPGYRKRCRFHWPHGHLQPALKDSSGFSPSLSCFPSPSA